MYNVKIGFVGIGATVREVNDIFISMHILNVLHNILCSIVHVYYLILFIIIISRTQRQFTGFDEYKSEQEFADALLPKKDVLTAEEMANVQSPDFCTDPTKAPEVATKYTFDCELFRQKYVEGVNSRLGYNYINKQT